MSEENKTKGPKMVNVIGAKVPEGKKQHLKEGSTYRVTEENAKHMVKNKQAKYKK